MRFAWESKVIMRACIISPVWTFPSIPSIISAGISERWINPEIPPSSSKKIPNWERRRTGASIISPTWYLSARTCQGFAFNRLIEREIFSPSIPIIWTVTLSPTRAYLWGLFTCPQSISETCTRPSTPWNVTNKPYVKIPETAPSTTSPTFIVESACERCSSIAAFSEKMIFFPDWSRLITRTWNGFPTSLLSCSRIFSGLAFSTRG